MEQMSTVFKALGEGNFCFGSLFPLAKKGFLGDALPPIFLAVRLQVCHSPKNMDPDKLHTNRDLRRGGFELAFRGRHFACPKQTSSENL